MKNINFIHKDSKNKNKNIILFIHGFTGGEETWKATNTISFPEMLSNDEEITANFDVALINYLTELIYWNSPTIVINSILRSIKRSSKVTNKNVGILDLSLLLKTIINNHCTNYENIIIIAHSMGGVIAKSYILDDLTSNNPKVKLFLSLAVPHGGVEWANLGKWLFKNNKQIIDLATASPDLSKINNRWVKEFKGHPHTVYFYGQNDRVVSKESAIGIQSEEQEVEYSSDDHFSITKPLSEDSLIYTAVRNNLIEYLCKENEKNELSNNNSKEPNLTERPFIIVDFNEDVIPLHYPEFYNDINTKENIKNYQYLPSLSKIFNMEIKNIGKRYARNVKIHLEVRKEEALVTDDNLLWMMMNPLDSLNYEGDKYVQIEKIAYLEKEEGRKLLSFNSKLNGVLISSIYNIENFLVIQSHSFNHTLEYFKIKSKERPLLSPSIYIRLIYEDVENNTYENLYKISINNVLHYLGSHIGIKLETDFNYNSNN
ncbi:hypothetical protein MHI18_20625 [Peribacillus sp. FSL H8-0477]|uniref:PGAP1-like alpha/beta domain-containing protein n=1 Tax=Peribacillus sp. FSL H8-0477 TaxID=2921388 RepID=UPI0030FBE97F